MSSSIWTRCEGNYNLRLLDLHAWRVVGAQPMVSTIKLVDSMADQEILEELLNASRPKDPAPGLHELLKFPFRNPPLRHGSRFGTRLQRGIWYGSLELQTAFAETAYYRLLFLEGTKAKISRVILEQTAFQAHIDTGRGIDLCQSPFAKYHSKIASKTSYEQTQRLGQAMREDKVAAFIFPSARDGEGGTNLGVFDAKAIANRRPKSVQRWTAIVNRSVVEFSRQHFFVQERFRFERKQFEVRGKLPSPAI